MLYLLERSSNIISSDGVSEMDTDFLVVYPINFLGRNKNSFKPARALRVVKYSPKTTELATRGNVTFVRAVSHLREFNNERRFKAILILNLSVLRA